MPEPCGVVCAVCARRAGSRASLTRQLRPHDLDDDERRRSRNSTCSSRIPGSTWTSRTTRRARSRRGRSKPPVRRGLTKVGVKREDVRPGDAIRVRCHLLRDGSNGCLLGLRDAHARRSWREATASRGTGTATAAPDSTRPPLSRRRGRLPLLARASGFRKQGHCSSASFW